MPDQFVHDLSTHSHGCNYDSGLFVHPPKSLCDCQRRKPMRGRLTVMRLLPKGTLVPCVWLDRHKVPQFLLYHSFSTSVCVCVFLCGCFLCVFVHVLFLVCLCALFNSSMHVSGFFVCVCAHL